jgi:hypothetical protein
LVSEIRRRKWIAFWLLDQSGANRIVEDVTSMIGEVFRVVNSMVAKTLLPDWNLVRLSEAIRVAAFDELDRALEGTIWCGRDQQVEVVRHDDELVKKNSSLSTIVEENF